MNAAKDNINHHLAKKLIVFIFCVLVLSVSAQPKGRFNKAPIFSPIKIETHIIPRDSNFTCFVSYKADINDLMFVKENGKFNAGLKIDIEVIKDDKTVDRVIKSSNITVNDYDLTNRHGVFLEDFTECKLDGGKYIFNPLISIENTDFEFNSSPIEVNVDSSHLSFPYAVYKEKLLIRQENLYHLVNMGNSIPYSLIEYDLLIPVYENSISKIEVEIVQNGITLFNKELTEYEEINGKVDSYENQIIIFDDPNTHKAKFFKISSVNKKLNEGPIKIILKYNDKAAEFNLPVYWYDKPRSLRDPELAIEMLELIGRSEQADSLLSFDEEEYYKVLYDYWKNFDNDTSTAFNEVFAEYYSRIDYTNKNFKSLDNNLGAESDRGEVYIKYGEPDSINRSYTEQYNIIEIWEYKSLGKQIIFADRTGTGKFIRIK